MIGGIELWLILGVAAIFFGPYLVKKLIRSGKDIKKEFESIDEDDKTQIKKQEK